MALLACPECSNQISDQAAACPHCGCPARAWAKPPPAPPSPIAKQPQHPNATGIPAGAYFAAGIVGLVTIAFGINAAMEKYDAYQENKRKEIYIKKMAEHKAKRDAIEAAKSPEQKAAEAKARLEQEAKEKKAAAEKQAAEAAAAKKVADTKNAKELAFQRTVLFIASLKERMREPDSVKWDTILANDDGSVICVQYRGRNGFGGYSAEHAAYAVKTASQAAYFWNQHCAGKSLNNMSHATYALN